MADQKKILFLAYFYPPAAGKALPGSQRTVKFVRYLPNFKKYILTIHAKFYPDYFSIDEHAVLPVHDEYIIRTGVFDLFASVLKFKQLLSNLFKRKKDNLITAAITVKESVQRVPSAQGSFTGKVKDIFSDLLTLPDFAYAWILPAFWNGLRAVHRHKIDCIFATGMPWSSLVVARMIQLFSGVKVIVDFRDPWVNNPYISGKTSIRQRIERFLEKSIVNAAHAVILNTEELCDDFRHRYHWLNAAKFHTLMNGYDEYDFLRLDLVAKSKFEEKSPELILLHAGFLYGARDPKPIFQAIEKIRMQHRDQGDRIRFQQIGDLNLNYDLKKYLDSINCGSNYEELGQLSYRQCLQKMAKADILVIIQQATATQIPSKIYEYIFLDKPIITISQKDGALASLVQKYQIGEFYQPEDTSEIAESLHMHLVRKTREEKGFGGYAYRHLFDVRSIASQLENIVNKITS